MNNTVIVCATLAGLVSFVANALFLHALLQTVYNASDVSEWLQ